MDLSNYRRDYSSQPVDETTLSDDPTEQFDRWFNEALNAGIQDPNAMSLATVSSDLQPVQRIVLLKRYDSNGFVFFTNLESRKAQHIAQNARVSLHFSWLPLNRQIIVTGSAKRVSTQEALQYFMTRPRGSQLAAWISNQSQTLSARALLEEKFQEISRKFSSGDIPLPSFWGGYRVSPDTIEFWQGQENRLHDRFLYSKIKSGWQRKRLAP